LFDNTHDLHAGIEMRPMRWTLFAPALLLAATGLGEPANAFSPLGAITGILSLPFRAFSYHPYYRHYVHRHHYVHRRVVRRYSRERAVAIRSGLWEFRDRLAAGPSGAASPNKGGLSTTLFGCIDPPKVVPIELGPQCRVDNSRRDGPSITWSMSCSNALDTVRSDGTGRYYGETMAATMISHLPIGNGAVSNVPQRITGRYLGPCLRSTQIANNRPWTVPGSGGSARPVEPGSRSGAADAASQRGE
jgi:hypothetical protein